MNSGFYSSKNQRPKDEVYYNTYTERRNQSIGFNPKETLITEANKFSKAVDQSLNAFDFLDNNSQKELDNNNIMTSFATHCTSPERLSKGMKLLLDIKSNKSPKKMKEKLFDSSPNTLSNILNGRRANETLESKFEKLERAISGKKKNNGKNSINLNYCSKEINSSPLRMRLNKPFVSIPNEKIDSYTSFYMQTSPTRRKNLIKAGLFRKLESICRSNSRSKYQ